ncbi:MAG: ATP-binding protein [Candidatus Magnetoovum sp. WYHC-5]|nr:ATP-binding protein [Candidatus Magnetoovum sp. WYHC-5]
MIIIRNRRYLAYKKNNRTQKGHLCTSRLQLIISEQRGRISCLASQIDEFQRIILDQNDIIDGLKHSREKIVQCEKLAALGRFTADVAHEIRNPLTAVGGFARRLLKKLTDSEREREYARIIVSEVDRLEKILKDVLTFSRDTKPVFEKLSIVDVVNESLRFFADILVDQSITVKQDFNDVPYVFIDRNQIRQVIDNLTSNAVDAMPERGVLTVKIGKEFMYDIHCVAVSITDTGTGIPHEKLDMIFEPFVTSKEIGQGTGLGLPISRKIMEEHKGFIRCESKLNEGSTFKIMFPYQPEEEAGKMQCWELMKCGKDRLNAGECSAYPHHGRICWAIAGTFCDGKAQGSYAQKIENCKRCKFYKSIHSGTQTS